MAASAYHVYVNKVIEAQYFLRRHYMFISDTLIGFWMCFFCWRPFPAHQCLQPLSVGCFALKLNFLHKKLHSSFCYFNFFISGDPWTLRNSQTEEKWKLSTLIQTELLLFCFFRKWRYFFDISIKLSIAMKICVVVPSLFMYISVRRSRDLNTNANSYELWSIIALQSTNTVNKMWW